MVSFLRLRIERVATAAAEDCPHTSTATRIEWQGTIFIINKNIPHAKRSIKESPSERFSAKSGSTLAHNCFCKSPRRSVRGLSHVVSVTAS